MIFNLIQDFADALAAMPRAHPRQRILKLLDEAIRRDVHFIDRHPTTFFQCMWNTCWWYDCPEAGRHYERPKDSSSLENPPWDHCGPRVSTLLESWRRSKEKEMVPGFRWLRSLRPPFSHLGTAQTAVFRGDSVERQWRRIQ